MTGFTLATDQPLERRRLTSPWLIRVLAVGLTLACLTSSADGQVTLNRIFPPVISTGETTPVAAEGKFASWPPTILCDREDVQITAAEDSGKLNVRVDDAVTEASGSGIAWVRLTDPQSASDWVPILITSANVIEETEPNNRIEEIQTVTMPAVIAGRLAKSG